MADPEGVLAFLQELEVADEEVGARLEELDELARETEAVRSTALELEAFEARLPSERERVAGELEQAEEDAAAARDALAAAEKAMQAATDDREADSGHFLVRARDRLAVAERRRSEADGARRDLEVLAGAAEEEARELERKARVLAGTLRGQPRLAEDAGADPGPGFAGIAGWGETARASLFVARGQAAAEREAIIRQANEVAALALGEPLSSLGAARVAQRVEEKLGRDGA
jgi:hypothetical protein